MNWEMGSTIAAWLSIAVGFVIYIYRRGKKDGEINVQLTQLTYKIDEHICHKGDYVLSTRCGELSGMCQDGVETTTNTFENQVTLIHSRLNAMDSKRDDAAEDRNRRFEKLGDNVAEIKDKLTDEMSEINKAVAGLTAGVEGYQQSLSLILKKHLGSSKT